MTDHRAKAVDATGTPPVAASVDNTPGYGAVDGSEPERRYLNAQTRVIRHCPYCGIRSPLSGESNCLLRPRRRPVNDTDPNSQITDGLTRALADPGEMLTRYVAVAELMNSDGNFRLAFSRDGVTPWDCVGMMRWTADHMYDSEDDDQ